MSIRLPLLQTRPGAAASPAQETAAGPRVSPPRALVCVASGDAAQEPALRFACALTHALATRGCAPMVVLEQGIRAGAGSALEKAGAARALALPKGELLDTAREALESLPAHALAIGIGRELAARFEPLLGVAIGVRLAAADLELPAPSTGVASIIGAWLAEHARALQRS